MEGRDKGGIKWGGLGSADNLLFLWELDTHYTGVFVKIYSSKNIQFLQFFCTLIKQIKSTKKGRKINGYCFSIVRYGQILYYYLYIPFPKFSI